MFATILKTFIHFVSQTKHGMLTCMHTLTWPVWTWFCPWWENRYQYLPHRPAKGTTRDSGHSGQWGTRILPRIGKHRLASSSSAKLSVSRLMLKKCSKNGEKVKKSLKNPQDLPKRIMQYSFKENVNFTTILQYDWQNYIYLRWIPWLNTCILCEMITTIKLIKISITLCSCCCFL
jgi:hypothetical protein